MIRLLAQLPAHWLFRAVGKPRVLPLALTLRVTDRCNSRCKTCNIHAVPGKKPELSRDELEKVFAGFGGRIFWLTLTGGEPFLRDELADICRSAYAHLRPRMITIPTNGILCERIPQVAERIIRECPDTRITLNLSLDGVGPAHDEIRGVAGNFDAALKTYAGLRKIRAANFRLQVYTTVSKYNVADIAAVSARVEELRPDGHAIEIADERPEFANRGFGIRPGPREYAGASAYITKRMRAKRCGGREAVVRALRLCYYDAALRIVNGRRGADCRAGFSQAYILHDGEVWACSTKAGKMGSLRDAGYDFRAIWFSAKSDAVRRDIRRAGCSCTCAGANYVNMLFDPGSWAACGRNLLVLR